MQWILTGLQKLEQRGGQPPPAAAPDRVRLKVSYCGVCRTDAKMWREGHRDLLLPRVPGHEIVARDEQGYPFAIWPGTACGTCRHCRRGRENLCDEMRIMGFHFDGGFSHDLLAPISALVPVPKEIPLHLACFAEPVGCVLNALEHLHLQQGERLLIVGGGTLGMITALAAGSLGATCRVVEKSAANIQFAQPFLRAIQAACVTPDRQEGRGFDAAITTCPDPLALVHAIDCLGKGGRLAFFSGLPGKRSMTMDTDLFNRIHYRELSVFGAYGLARRHMAQALAIIAQHPVCFDMLVEAIVPPDTLPDILPRVLAGGVFRFILDFQNDKGSGSIL
jgi:D-arabinose 1-dehydrogenase-like Zn-dependent alcohol dehydrogenase